MNLQDLKVYAANFTAFSISLTNVELYLKIFLLLVTIGYTLAKWNEVRQKNKK